MCVLVSLCVVISNKIEVAVIAIDEAMILEIKVTIASPFQSSLTIF